MTTNMSNACSDCGSVSAVGFAGGMCDDCCSHLRSREQQTDTPETTPPPYVAPKRPLGERLQQGVSNQLMAGSVGFAAVLLVIAWLLGLSELYGYLKVGNWPHYVLWKVLHDLVPVSMVSWVEFPQDWFGLHKVVSWVFLKCPVEAVLLALSFVVFVVGAKLADSLDIRPRPRH
jgi:hypothetical protein